MVYIAPQTEYDEYFISVKNRLKDYFIAANSIPYLPAEQQTSAYALLKRIDDFINNRMFETVRKFMAKDIEENDAEKKHSVSNSNGHLCLITKYFILMDYSTFEYAENNGRNYYTDISIMDSLPVQEIMPAIQKAADEFNKLSRCDSLDDLTEIYYYKNADKALMAAAYGDMSIQEYDAQQNTLTVAITPKTTTQAKAMMSFFESNWEAKAESYEDNICCFDGWLGTPVLEVTLRYQENGMSGAKSFVPCHIAIHPTPDFDAYGGKIHKSDVPQEFMDMLNNDPEMIQINKEISKAARTNNERTDI